MKIATAVQLREIDRLATRDFHIPSIVLMENAALAVVDAITEHYGFAAVRDRTLSDTQSQPRSKFVPDESAQTKRVAIVCGKGGNGGDGLAIARHLHNRFNVAVTVVLACDPSELKGDTLSQFKMISSLGVEVVAAEPKVDAAVPRFSFKDHDLVVDAVFGTGFTGTVSAPISTLIKSMNSSGRPIVAVDVPSGLNADKGHARGDVVKAELTVTFVLPKFGLLVHPGCDFAGRVLVADISMPKAAIEAQDIRAFRTDASEVAVKFQRRHNKLGTNKGAFGHAVLFAGSSDYHGAAVLSTNAAIRTGAGLVTLATPATIATAVAARISPVAMTASLPASAQGAFANSGLSRALDLIGADTTTATDTRAASGEPAPVANVAGDVTFARDRKINAVAIGPGISRATEMTWLRELIARCQSPLVIDADALNLLSTEPDRGVALVRARQAATILTPHPGELARLLETTIDVIGDDRKAAAQKAAELYNCVVVLKGSRTLTASPDGSLFVNTTGNPGLSSGGTGDALTGIITALLAQHLAPLDAAALGVYLHGLAGDLAAQALGGTTGLSAVDLIEQLPRAISSCQRN